MGYFNMNSEKQKTVEGCMRNAQANLELLRGLDVNEYNYLLSFIKISLEDALKAIENESPVFELENNRYSW